MRNDALIYYIAPRMQLYVKLSAMALYVIAAYQLYSGIRALFEQHDRSCGCGHNEPPPSSPMKTTVLTPCFYFPFCLALGCPTRCWTVRWRARGGSI
ncbi:DUF1980 domain-containing protein [Paenibacillus sp. MSJ-34]|nr:DUF1980 domain-containing protein [Paenibacillus sp. MSJ-34]